MISILIDNKPAILQKGSSFEFIAENNAFESSDGYSFEMTFPLLDCRENVDIFGFITLPYIDKPLDRLPCQIQTGTFYAKGSFAIMEVSESYVKGQFLQNVDHKEDADFMDKTFINELDLGSFPETDPKRWSPAEGLTGSTDAYCLPWTPFDTDDVINNKALNFQQFDESVTFLTWQPRLLKIVETIVYRMGYKFEQSYYDFLMKGTVWHQAIICNTLPMSWEMSGYADALPGWTLTEFFDKLALFLGGKFTIDHIDKTVGFTLDEDAEENAGTVYLSEVTSQYTAEISRDEEDAGYLPIRKYKYPDCDAEIWGLLSCPEYIAMMEQGNIKVYDTLNQLRNEAENFAKWRNRNHRNTPASELCYAKDVDTYFILRYIVTRASVFNIYSKNFNYVKFGELQPVNVFGPEDYDPDSSYEELDFVPVPVDWNLDGKTFMLPPVSDDDTDSEDLDVSGSGEVGIEQPDGLWLSTDVSVSQGRAFNQIMTTTGSTKKQYYDRIYIGFAAPSNIWNANNYNRCYPYTDIMINRCDPPWVTAKYLRLTKGKVGFASSRNIDQKTVYNFTFLHDRIPDPKALFIIKGQRFVCRKITATISENGVSQLMKGEFFRVLDDPD